MHHSLQIPFLHEIVAHSLGNKKMRICRVSECCLEAGISGIKMSYNLSSKDDLILAFLLCGLEYAFCPALRQEYCIQDYANL